MSILRDTAVGLPLRLASGLPSARTLRSRNSGILHSSRKPRPGICMEFADGGLGLGGEPVPVPVAEPLGGDGPADSDHHGAGPGRQGPLRQQVEGPGHRDGQDRDPGLDGQQGSSLS
jgi:hypothetical protein